MGAWGSSSANGKATDLPNPLLHVAGVGTIATSHASNAPSIDPKSGAIRLAIDLPTAYTGGAIVMSFGDETVKIEDAKSAELLPHWTAYFADVQCVIEQINHGHRCILNYDLETHLDKRTYTTASINRVKGELPDIVRRWIAHVDGQPGKQNVTRLLHTLGKIEGDAPPAMASLPFGVRRQITLLSEACAGAHTDILLGVLNRKVEGHERVDDFDTYEVDEDREESLFLDNVHTLSGELVATNIAAFHQQLICTDVLREKADQEDSRTERYDPHPFSKHSYYYDDECGYPDEYTGDDAPSWGYDRQYDRYYTQCWRRLVAVFIPQAYMSAFKLSVLERLPAKQLVGRLGPLVASLRTDATQEQVRDELLMVCKLLVRDPSLHRMGKREDAAADGGAKSKLIGPLLEACDLLSDAQIFTMAVANARCRPCNIVAVLKSRAQQGSGWPQIQPWLEAAKARRGSATSRLDLLHAIREMLTRFYDGPEVRAWYKAEFLGMIPSLKFASDDAGAVFAAAAQADEREFCNDPSQLLANATPHSSFALAFLSAAYGSWEEGAVKRSRIRRLFIATLRYLDVRMDDFALSEPARAWVISKEKRVQAKSAEVAGLIAQCASLELGTELELLLAIVLRQAKDELKGIDPERTPCLVTELASKLSTHDGLLVDNAIKKFLTQLINVYRRNVGVRPMKSNDLCRSPCHCRCGTMDCKALDAFLLSASRPSYDVKLKAARIAHLQEQLRRSKKSGLPLDFTFTTDKANDVQRKLTVIKTDNMRSTESSRWEARCQMFIRTMRGMDETVARKVLLAMGGLLRLIQAKRPGGLKRPAMKDEYDSDSDFDGPDLRLFSAEIRLLLDDCLALECAEAEHSFGDGTDRADCTGYLRNGQQQQEPRAPTANLTRREQSRADYSATFRSLDGDSAKALLGEEEYAELIDGADSEERDVFDDSDDGDEEVAEVDITQLERMTFSQVSRLKRPPSPTYVNTGVKRRMLEQKANGQDLVERENWPPDVLHGCAHPTPSDSGSPDATCESPAQ
ncbi:hypothetical protein LTR85_005066 [Meristemomyces frigidus]|nr:hypothetical protein LTR85_005066 [Meristemomyces frigidus]